MIEIRIEDKPSFAVLGKKTWIGGQENEQFGQFWAQCNNDGTMELLRTVGIQPGPCTGGMALGVSRVENDPENRSFWFMVAMESEQNAASGLEAYTVPASRWAVFRARGAMPMALVDAEMHAFGTWLPTSGYRHAAAPEMEVYPPDDPGEEMLVEFWLPIMPV